jgi:hypothetical protein
VLGIRDPSVFKLMSSKLFLVLTSESDAMFSSNWSFICIISFAFLLCGCTEVVLQVVTESDAMVSLKFVEPIIC